MDQNDVRHANSQLTRRAVVGGAALAGIATIFGRQTSLAATKRTTTKKKTTTKKVTTTKAATAATTVATTADGSGSSSATGAFSPSQRVVVSYTYKPTGGGGRVHNPFVAVWVEDTDGVPVRIVHFEYELGKGRRWINEMKRWARVDELLVALGKESSADTTTSATRVPGSYTVAWDGKNADGEYVPNGNYVVYVEAAREKGPYQFVKQAITLNGKAFKKTGTPNGEISAFAVQLRAA